MNADELPVREQLARLERGTRELRDRFKDSRAMNQLEIKLIPLGKEIEDRHMEQARAIAEAGEQLTQFETDIEGIIDRETEQELSKLVTPSGLKAWTAEMKTQIREGVSLRNYEKLQELAIGVGAKAEARQQALKEQIEKSRRAPKPKADVATDTRTLVLFRLFEGRTLPDVVSEYERLADGDEPALTFFAEHYSPSDLQRILRLRPSDRSEIDNAAVVRLQKAIQARGDARQDKAATAELAFLEQDRVNNSFGRAHLIKTAKRHRQAPKDFRDAVGVAKR